MRLHVCKFGGTSVETPHKITAIATALAKRYQNGDRFVVVVSAMGHTTDQLFEQAQQITKAPPSRELDMLLSAGERISMALMSMALVNQGVPALSLTGSQCGILTDSRHREARIQKILGDRIRSALQKQQVVVVAGFQGVCPETKEVTTLGRGGSDTTAVALAVSLQCENCEIYTDVDGVFSGDPRFVSRARLWNELDYDSLLECANGGAAVIHPRAVLLAKKFNLPLKILNSNIFTQSNISNDQDQKNYGTVVRGVNTRSLMEDEKINKRALESAEIIGVTMNTEKVHVELKFLNNVVFLFYRWLKQQEKPVQVLLSQQFENESAVHLLINRDQQEDWKKSFGDFCSYVKQEASEGSVEWHFTQYIPVSIVANGGLDSCDIWKSYEVLQALDIPLFLSAHRDRSLHFLIDRAVATKVTQALHECYFKA